MNKSEEKAKTLLEYMGFKDPDIHTHTHDDWVMKLADDKILTKIFKPESIAEITIEKVLSDRYRKYGFLDIFVVDRITRQVPFAFSGEKYDKTGQYDPTLHTTFAHWRYNFIEIKTNNPSLGSVIREMEYYRDCLEKIHSSEEVFGLLISNLKFPESFHQFDHMTFDEVEKLIKENDINV